MHALLQLDMKEIKGAVCIPTFCYCGMGIAAALPQHHLEEIKFLQNYESETELQ